MERINLAYNFFGDDDTTEKRIEMTIENDYIGLDDLAKELKRFLIAAGYSIESLVINDSFGASDDE